VGELTAAGLSDILTPGACGMAGSSEPDGRGESTSPGTETERPLSLDLSIGLRLRYPDPDPVIEVSLLWLC